MKVLVVDHVAGVKTFRQKYGILASDPDVDLTLFLPKTWIENGKLVDGSQAVEAYPIRKGRAGFRGYENRGFFYSGLSKAMRSVRPDILHLVEEPFSLIALQCVLLAGVHCPRAKILFYTFDNLHKGFRYPYRPSKVYGLIQRFVHKRVECGTVGCTDALSVLRSRGFYKPVRFVPLGVDEEHFRKSDVRELREFLKLSGFVIGFVGRLLPVKGIPVLLAALNRLEADWSCLFVGDGKERRTIEAFAGRHRRRGKVCVLPNIPHDKMPEYLSLMDVLVLPSITSDRSKEQFGRVLIEAMACEVPVVGSDSGSIPEVIGDGGCIVPEGDPSALTSALRQLIEAPSRRAELSAAGRKRVLEHFTWRRVAQIYKSIYDGLMSGPLESEEKPEWSTSFSSSRP